MSYPGGACTITSTGYNFFVLGPPASLIGSELPSYLAPALLSWIETVVTFCGMVW